LSTSISSRALASGLGDDDVVLIPERAVGRVQQADPAVIAPVNDDILSSPCVTKEEKLKIQVEQVRHRVERRLGPRIRGALRDNVAQVRPLETRPRPVLLLVCEMRERALDYPPVVAQRHGGVRYAAHLALQAVGGLLRRLERVAPGGVRS